jgi:hypothetical protein
MKHPLFKYFLGFVFLVGDFVNSHNLLRGNDLNNLFLLEEKEADRAVIRGVNFNGIESNCKAPLGLFDKPLTFFYDFLVENDFNAIRIPLSYEIMQDLSQGIGDCVSQEPSMYAYMPAEKMIYRLLDEAESRNLTVLFDLHTIGGVITPYPWTDSVTEEQVIHSWLHFLSEFGSHPALHGIEIKNEPHSDISTSVFLDHCVRVIRAITESIPDYGGLFYLSGTQVGVSPWGGAYDPSAFTSDHALLEYQSRLVLCPHVYGTSVRGEGVSSEGEDHWEVNYGFVSSLDSGWSEVPVIPTEIGGFLEGSDLDYYSRWREWHVLKKNFRAGFFWWTLGDFSMDTGGLFTRSYEVESHKIEYIKSFYE